MFNQRNLKEAAIRLVWLCAGFVLCALGVTFSQVETDAYFVVLALTVPLALIACALIAIAQVDKQRKYFYGHEDLLNLRSFRWPKYHFYAGTPEQFARYFEPLSHLPERIALVSFKHCNGNIYAVERPGRHHHLVALLYEHGLRKDRDHRVDQGFVTSHGRHVSRTEALIIASSMNQVIRKTSNLAKLFSEDLWVTPAEYRYPAIDDKQYVHDGWIRQTIEQTLPSDLELYTVVDGNQQSLYDQTLEMIQTIPEPAIPHIDFEHLTLAEMSLIVNKAHEEVRKYASLLHTWGVGPGATLSDPPTRGAPLEQLVCHLIQTGNFLRELRKHKQQWIESNAPEKMRENTARFVKAYNELESNKDGQ